MEWTEPPKPFGGRPSESKWGEAAEQLRQNPGRWARVREWPWREGGQEASTRWLTAGEFEVVSRSEERDGQRVRAVYARYIG